MKIGSSKSKIVDAHKDQNITKAVDILTKGGLVAFPTETVYGLGADGLNAKAVARVFEVKKRPSFDPVIVHVGTRDDAFSLWGEKNQLASELMNAFWPGPLTLVMSRSERVPDIVTAGLPTAAVRMPDSEIALRIINELGHPVAAPSANLFGRPSPTTAAAVQEELGDGIDLILDNGPAKIGLESTIIKIEGAKCTLLRPGGIPVEVIEKICRVDQPVVDSHFSPEAPGQLQAHYAPNTQFTVMDKSYENLSREMQHLYDACQHRGVAWPKIGLLSMRKKENSSWFQVQRALTEKGDKAEAAARLFQEIRELDKLNLDLIIAETIDEAGLGLAIMDRIKKAAGGKRGIEKFFAMGEL